MLTLPKYKSNILSVYNRRDYVWAINVRPQENIRSQRQRRLYWSLQNRKEKKTPLLRKKIEAPRKRLPTPTQDLLEYYDDINIPGMKYAIGKRFPRWMRVLWSLAVLTCFGLVVIQIGERLATYYGYPVILIVNIEKQTRIELPNVTLCPNTIPYKIRRKGGERDLEKLWREEMMPSITIDVWYQDLYDNKQKIGVSFEKQHILTLWGNCSIFIFPKMVEYFGFTTKLQFLIKENETVNESILEELQINTENEKRRASISFWFYLNSEEFFPIHSPYLHSKDVPRNSIFAAEIEEMRRFKLLNTPKNPCVNSNTFSECWNKCLYQKMKENVTCRLPFMNPEYGDRNCSRNNANATFTSLIHVFDSISRETCSCIRSCDQILFKLDDLKENNSSIGETALIFSFESNVRENAEEKYAYTFSQLISDIGGSLGLFLGCCILTILEIFQSIGVRLIRSIQVK